MRPSSRNTKVWTDSRSTVASKPKLHRSATAASGTINVSTGPVLVAQGQEGGPFFDFNRNKSAFAPDVQLGYMVPFANDWLAGLKFAYKYANVDSKENVIIPQTGTGTILVGPQAPSTGVITGFVQGLAQINLKHQLVLIATIGRAFGNVAAYAGGGPALFGIETNFFNGVPFATSAQGRMFKSLAGIPDLVHVPYRGQGRRPPTRSADRLRWSYRP
jgi:hypothetical protein